MSVEPGCPTFWSAPQRPSEVVQATGVENLWVMPAGKTPPNPAELLGSRRFAELTSSCRRSICVIIDTPPVLAVTDAAVIAHRASGVLFVIAADVTSRQAAQTALDQLEHARAKFLGAVLNRVDVERDATTTHATTARTTRTTTPRILFAWHAELPSPHRAQRPFA